MFVKKGIVIGLGGAGEVDDTHVGRHSCIVRNDHVWCYYTAYDGIYYHAALAVSRDGVNFIKKGVVIPRGNVGEIDDIHAYYPTCIIRNGHVWCYYIAYDGSNPRVALAISKDGMNFVKKGVVIGLGEAGEVDDTYAYVPSCITRNGHVWCYYSVYNGSNIRIALAIAKDGMNFVKKGVVIPLGDAGEVDNKYAYRPSCIVRNRHIWCYYSAYDGSNIRIALAIAKDGMNFIKKGVVIPLGSAGEIDDTHTSMPACIIRDRYVWCYYRAYDGSKYRIALAISENGT